MVLRMVWGREVFLSVCLLAACLLLPAPATAQTAKSAAPVTTTGVSGLALPRFVSVTASRANLRKGPGRQYPIDWILQRRNLPVEIIGEYEHWRKIRERSGEVGWVHKTMLSGKRTGQVIAEGKTGTLLTAYATPGADATGDAKIAGPKPVLLAEPGAIGEILACTPEWCQLKFKEGKGWLRRENLWGVYPGEEEM